MKTCTKCGEEKPLSSFSCCSASRSGLLTQCKVCKSKYDKERWSANKDVLRAKGRERYRSHGKLWNYGISNEDWDNLFKQQGECCAICKTTEPNKGQWCTDHDHATGKVRGILCHHCNVGLGHFRDSIDLLQLATTYLLNPPYKEPDDDRNEDQV